MARRFITPRINKLFADSVREVITELSKRHKFEVLLVTSVTCPNCIIDPTTGKSMGKYKVGGPQPFDGKTCPVCKTTGKQSTEKKRRVVAAVNTGTSAPNSNIPMSEGMLFVGQAKVKVTKENKSLLDNAAAYYIDNLRYRRLTNPESRGLQTLVTSFMFLERDD